MRTNRIVAEFFVDHSVVLNAMDCSRSKTFFPTLFLLQVSWWWLFSFLESLPVSLDIQSALEQGLHGDRLKKKNSHPQLKNTKNQLQLVVYKINQCKTATNTICSPVFNFETEKLPKNCPSHLQVGHSTKAHSCFLAGLRSPAFLQKLEGTCRHLRWAGSYWGCWWWCGSWQGCRWWCGSCQAWRWWCVLTSCVMLRSVSLIVQANLLRCSPKKEIVKSKLFQSPRKKLPTQHCLSIESILISTQPIQ